MKQKKQVIESEYSYGLNMVITKKDGENLVPAINNGDSYDYVIMADEDNVSFFGHIKRNPTFKNCEDLKQRYAEVEYLNDLEKEYERGSSEEYFNSTEDVALEFEKVNEEFLALLYDKTIPEKKKYKNPIFDKRQGFLGYHPEISKIDIRICHLGYTSCEIDENGEYKNVSTRIFQPTPRIDYKTYKEFIDEYLIKKKAELIFEAEDELKNLDSEFEETKKTIESLLETNSKVGLVSIWTAVPKRMKEIEIKIDSFDIESFLTFSRNTIYWFSK